MVYQNLEKKAVMFIPLEGCGDCIRQSCTFVNEELVTLEGLHVIVDVIYQKQLDVSFSSDVLSNRRLKGDSLDWFGVLGVGNYPVVGLIDGLDAKWYPYDDDGFDSVISITKKFLIGKAP